MTLDQQIQYLKKHSLWGDFLTEIGEGNFATISETNIVANVIWENAKTSVDWAEVYNNMFSTPSVRDIDMHELIEQWKKEYPEYFV